MERTTRRQPPRLGTKVREPEKLTTVLYIVQVDTEHKVVRMAYQPDGTAAVGCSFEDFWIFWETVT
jgi:hypothetical protein